MDAKYGRKILTATLLGIVLTLGFGGQAAYAEPYRVDSTDDAVDVDPGDGFCRTKAQRCTLRAAIMEANALPGHQVVIVPAGHYRLTIPGRGEDAAAAGDLDITDHLTIEGAGFDGSSASTIVDGNGLDRVFDVPEGRALVLIGLVVKGGDESEGYGGGGIRSRGVLSLSHARVGENRATVGGGIYSAGVLALESVRIDGNAAQNGTGGGIVARGGQARIENAAIDGNEAALDGGGIWVVEGATMTLNGVTLSNNRGSGSGGGLLVAQASVDATNVTFSGNAAGQGGGLGSRIAPTPIRLLNVTFFGNRAMEGGAIFSDETPVRIRNSIVARSLGNARNCVGPITSEGFNIDSRESCGFTARGDRMTTNPNLSELRDNGGFTLTHQPLRDSWAIDLADNDSCPPVDQRGVPRPVDGDGDRRAVCDGGAVEVSRRAQ